MKLAISNLAWAGVDAEPYYRLLVDWRIGGLEVAPSVLFSGNWSAAFCTREVSRHRKALAANGITTIGLQSLFYGHPEFQLAEGPDTDTGTRLLAHAQQLVQLCCELGGQYLLIGAPANRKRCGYTPEDAESRAAETLNRIGDYADECGVYFTLEVLPAEFGSELGCSLPDIARLISRAASPGVRPHLDTGTTLFDTTIGFTPAAFGSVQVSSQTGISLTEDVQQLQWAQFLASDLTAPRWISLELPPAPEQSFAANRDRIHQRVDAIRGVFGCE
jgi:sugar phosphate isomerase/epimerase